MKVYILKKHDIEYKNHKILDVFISKEDAEHSMSIYKRTTNAIEASFLSIEEKKLCKLDERGMTRDPTDFEILRYADFYNGDLLKSSYFKFHGHKMEVDDE